jgi:putative membrane protein
MKLNLPHVAGVDRERQSHRFRPSRVSHLQEVTMLKSMLSTATLALMLAGGAITGAHAQAAATGSSARISKEQFVSMAAMSDMLEIQSSKLALEKARSQDVKAFAQQMITDHTAASQKLQSATGLKPPAALDQKHAVMLKKLTDASAAQFDSAYVTMQAQAHKEAVQLFQTYATSGDDAALKSFASATLPTLKQHLQHVQQLQKGVK